MLANLLLVPVLVKGHGFVTKPMSRSQLVCDKLYHDYLKGYNNDNFFCKTDRESHCKQTAENGACTFPGLPVGPGGATVPTGKHPGWAVPKSPVCSAGEDTRISKEAVTLLNAPGPVTANYTAGDVVEMTWQLAAWHGGYYSYRICADGTDTETCFNQVQ